MVMWRYNPGTDSCYQKLPSTPGKKYGLLKFWINNMFTSWLVGLISPNLFPQKRFVRHLMTSATWGIDWNETLPYPKPMLPKSSKRITCFGKNDNSITEISSSINRYGSIIIYKHCQYTQMNTQIWKIGLYLVQFNFRLAYLKTP